MSRAAQAPGRGGHRSDERGDTRRPLRAPREDYECDPDQQHHRQRAADERRATGVDRVQAADRPHGDREEEGHREHVQDPLGDPTKDRLVLTRKDTGEFNQTDLTVAGAGWTTSEAYTAGVNAAFTVDGGTVQYSKSNVVKSAINTDRLPYDASGVYFVVSSSNVAETSGFCSRMYCTNCRSHSATWLRGTLSRKPFVPA